MLTHHPPNKSPASGETGRANNSNIEQNHPAISRRLTQVKCTLDAALELSKSGLPVFPCRADKKPSCPSGFKAASADPAIIKALWRDYPGTLAGMPTGKASGLDVLDIDPRHNGDAWLNAHKHRLPLTRVHKTLSGGQHCLFRCCHSLRCSTSKIAPGVDVRAEGGYIIWWPTAGLPVLNEAPLADWPEWILEALLPAPTPVLVKSLQRVSKGNAYARAALRNGARRVARAPEGTRNNALYKEAWALSRFVASGDLDIETIATCLASAAFGTGLKKSEIIATIKSATHARGIL